MHIQRAYYPSYSVTYISKPNSYAYESIPELLSRLSK